MATRRFSFGEKLPNMTKQYVFLLAVAKIKPGLAWICVSSVSDDVQELLKVFSITMSRDSPAGAVLTWSRVQVVLPLFGMGLILKEHSWLCHA